MSNGSQPDAGRVLVEVENLADIVKRARRDRIDLAARRVPRPAIGGDTTRLDE